MTALVGDRMVCLKRFYSFIMAAAFLSVCVDGFSVKEVNVSMNYSGTEKAYLKWNRGIENLYVISFELTGDEGTTPHNVHFCFNKNGAIVPLGFSQNIDWSQIPGGEKFNGVEFNPSGALMEEGYLTFGKGEGKGCSDGKDKFYVGFFDYGWSPLTNEMTIYFGVKKKKDHCCRVLSCCLCDCVVRAIVCGADYLCEMKECLEGMEKKHDWHNGSKPDSTIFISDDVKLQIGDIENQSQGAVKDLVGKYGIGKTTNLGKQPHDDTKEYLVSMQPNMKSPLIEHNQ